MTTPNFQSPTPKSVSHWELGRWELDVDSM